MALQDRDGMQTPAVRSLSMAFQGKYHPHTSILFEHILTGSLSSNMLFRDYL